MFLLENIKKSYGRTSVLSGASFSLCPGETLCLAGMNAAGKTTLLSIAAGLLRPDGGRVNCKGQIRFVPQENALLDDLTVRENLTLWHLTVRRGQKPFAPHTAETALGLAPYAKKRIPQLSGGLKKRTAIACALAGDPDYLLMDEPFTALDWESRGIICTVLERLKGEGKGILFSSHDPAAIARAADRALFLSDGVIAGETVFEGSEEQRLQSAAMLLGGRMERGKS